MTRNARHHLADFIPNVLQGVKHNILTFLLIRYNVQAEFCFPEKGFS